MISRGMPSKVVDLLKAWQWKNENGFCGRPLSILIVMKV